MIICDVLFISAAKTTAPQTSCLYADDTWQDGFLFCILLFFSILFWLLDLWCTEPLQARILPPYVTVTLGYLDHQTRDFSWPWTCGWALNNLNPPEVNFVCVRRLLFHQLWRRKAEGTVFCACPESLKFPCVLCFCRVTLRPSEKEAQIAGIFLRGIVGVCPVIDISTWKTCRKLVETWLQRHGTISPFMASCSWVGLQVAVTKQGAQHVPSDW